MTVPAGRPDPGDLLGLARGVAAEVAVRLEAALEEEVAVSTKSTHTDLVTELDTWAEAHIVDRLLEARPDDGILGEEGAAVAGTSGVVWCIDPIDGTVNFVHGIPGFCVSVAALVDGRAVAGVVVSPLHGDTFSATLGGGASRNDLPITCAAPVALDRAVIGTGFGYDRDRRRRQAEVLTRVLPRIADIRRGGAAALDLCWVACGRLDAYWEVGLNPWDHAAAALVASEAGARCEGPDGGPPSDALVVAASPTIWDPFTALLREAGATDV